jgi:Ca2+-binding EF-hand superfamily protein
MKEVGLKPTSSQLKDMMMECDPTGSNYIPFAEFLSVLAAKLRNTSRSDVLLQSFMSFDPENKGYIPASELKKHLTTWGNALTQQEWSAMLKEAGCSEADLFDYKKFVAHMTNSSQFFRLDGVIRR